MILVVDDKLYEEVDLTLDLLAERLEISSGYLSQIIKEKEGENLFEFMESERTEREEMIQWIILERGQVVA